MSREARTEAERERYSKLYRDRAYPKGNPERLCVWAGCEPWLPVIDLGCGRASLASVFFNYTGVDFTGEGFKGVSIISKFSKLVVASFVGADAFTSMPEVMEKEYELAICADVMEHIPPEDVEAVLRAFEKIKTKRIVFSIACFESRWKDESGGLHLTVREPEWWKQSLLAMQAFRVTRFALLGKTLFAELKKS